MKNIFKFILVIFLIAIELVPKRTYSMELQENLDINKTITTTTYPLTHQQTKGQVEFFREALDELGATSPEQVVKIWVKTEMSRNGVFHYAVACDELKSKMIKEFGEPQDGFWIYGGSSPWFDKYEIISNKKLSNSVYEVKIKFFWATSFSPIETTESTLTIVKSGDIWCVKEVN